jgi:hypothetical protein
MVASLIQMVSPNSSYTAEFLITSISDWKVAAGEVTGLQSFQTFETIFNNASSLDTGFVLY